MVLQAVCTIEWDIFFFSSLKMISHLFGGQFDLDIYHCAIRHFWWIAWYSWSDTMVMFWGCRRPGFERTCGSSRKGSEVGYPSRKTFIYIFWQLIPNWCQVDLDHKQHNYHDNDMSWWLVYWYDMHHIYIYVYIIFSIFNIHIIEDIWYMIVHDSILCIYILYDWYITYISIHRSIYHMLISPTSSVPGTSLPRFMAPSSPVPSHEVCSDRWMPGVDGSEIPRRPSTVWMYKKPVNTRISY